MCVRIVILVAVLVATYQMYRLESKRARSGIEVEEEVRGQWRTMRACILHSGGLTGSVRVV